MLTTAKPKKLNRKYCYVLLGVFQNIARTSFPPTLHVCHSSDPKAVNAQVSPPTTGPEGQVMSLSLSLRWCDPSPKIFSVLTTSKLVGLGVWWR